MASLIMNIIEYCLSGNILQYLGSISPILHGARTNSPQVLDVEQTAKTDSESALRKAENYAIDEALNIIGTAVPVREYKIWKELPALSKDAMQRAGYKYGTSFVSGSKYITKWPFTAAELAAEREARAIGAAQRGMFGTSVLSSLTARPAWLVGKYLNTQALQNK